jgi:hypothetical protein
MTAKTMMRMSVFLMAIPCGPAVRLPRRS